ncbi:transposase [Streptomyces sp. NBC_00285]|nr:transposase [Streptomyces sp. NBC_00285]
MCQWDPDQIRDDPQDYVTERLGQPDGPFATKPDLARVIVQRALDSALPIAWVTADAAYGQEWHFRRMLEEAGVGHVLAVPRSQQVKLPARSWRIDHVLSGPRPLGCSRQFWRPRGCRCPGGSAAGGLRLLYIGWCWGTELACDARSVRFCGRGAVIALWRRHTALLGARPRRVRLWAVLLSAHTVGPPHWRRLRFGTPPTCHAGRRRTKPEASAVRRSRSAGYGPCPSPNQPVTGRRSPVT